MGRLLLKLLGLKMAKRALANRNGRAPLIDIGLGFALLRDRRVPVQSKLTSLALGALGIAVLMALEAPVEALIALVLNIPGIGFDMMVDGLEILAGPVLLAAFALPRIAPRQIVDRLRFERGALPEAQTYPVR